MELLKKKTKRKKDNNIKNNKINIKQKKGVIKGF